MIRIAFILSQAAFAAASLDSSDESRSVNFNFNDKDCSVTKIWPKQIKKKRRGLYFGKSIEKQGGENSVVAEAANGENLAASGLRWHSNDVVSAENDICTINGVSRQMTAEEKKQFVENMSKAEQEMKLAQKFFRKKFGLKKLGKDIRPQTARNNKKRQSALPTTNFRINRNCVVHQVF